MYVCIVCELMYVCVHTCTMFMQAAAKISMLDDYYKNIWV